MRYLALLAAPLALLTAQPAFAGASVEALACPSKNVPAGLASSLGDVIVGGEKGTPAAKAAMASLSDLTDLCLKQHSIPNAQTEAYVAYVFDVVMLGEISRRLTASGVPVDALDEGLGFGPGRPNLPIERVEQSHLDNMTASLSKRGYDLAKAPEAVIRLIGMYIGARSGLAMDLAALK